MSTSTVAAVVAAGSSDDGDWKFILAAISIVVIGVTVTLAVDFYRNRK